MFKLFSLFAALCLALSACVTTPEPASTGVELNITGAADMNGGLPTQVKVYYLASDASFRSGDFFALFNAPEATLARRQRGPHGALNPWGRTCDVGPRRVQQLPQRGGA